MKRSLLPAFAALALASIAYGQGTTVSGTITLQNRDARDVPHLIRDVKGIDQVTCNLNSNSVVLRGTQEAVAAAEAEIRTADVPPARYRMAMRLVRYHVDGQGKYAETVVFRPTIFDTNDTPATMTMAEQGQDGYAFSVKPHRENDQAVTLSVEVQELGEQGEVVRSGKNVRLVELGKTVRITGMTDATDKPLRRAVQQGQIVTHHGAYTGYHVEVMPTAVP